MLISVMKSGTLQQNDLEPTATNNVNVGSSSGSVEAGDSDYYDPVSGDSLAGNSDDLTSPYINVIEFSLSLIHI